MKTVVTFPLLSIITVLSDRWDLKSARQNVGAAEPVAHNDGPLKLTTSGDVALQEFYEDGAQKSLVPAALIVVVFPLASLAATERNTPSNSCSSIAVLSVR